MNTDKHGFNRITFWSVAMLTFTAALALVAGASAQELYTSGFDKAEVEKVPEDMMVLDGGFAVKDEGGNKFLELPGAPLETFGVLFGPTEASGLSVSARVQSTNKGRRSPTFAVGLNGVGGYKLEVAPAKKLIELIKGEEIVASAPFNWESGSWTMLRLQCRKVKDGEFAIEGKAWKHGEAEPKAWQITRTEAAESPAGRSSIWGKPFAGTPVRFDDLKVTRAAQ